MSGAGARVEDGRLVVVGASKGGVRALVDLASCLRADFPAPVCVVLHIGAHRGILPSVLSGRGGLPAVHPNDGDRLAPGRIYVAPPDQHLRVEGDMLRLARGPKEHHTRPAIDPLFRSAAVSWGARTIGVVLTGTLNDGTAGMQAIKAHGGTCVVQDPRQAEAPDMPASVIEHVAVDHVVPLEAMEPLLGRLAADRTQRKPTMPDFRLAEHEDGLFTGRGDPIGHLRAIGMPSTFGCPDCKGTLWEIGGANPIRFRCHTGHAYTLETLLEAQSGSTDEALWSALRAVQEKHVLLHQAAQARRAFGDTAQASGLRPKPTNSRRRPRRCAG